MDDRTLGRNGYAAEWTGDQFPTHEEQRVLKWFRDELAKRCYGAGSLEG